MIEDIWTNSRLKAYQSCPMYEKFRYRDCLAPKGKKDALVFGTAIHKGIEMRSIEAALDELKFDYPGSTDEANAQEIMRGTVKAMLTGYFTHFPPFEEHEPELQFEIGARYPTKSGMRRSNRIKLCGKIDDLAMIDGKLWVIEYKTASKIDKSYFDRLYVDSQITFYMMAAKRIDLNPVGVLYRVLRKPQIKQRANETVDAYIERLTADYLARPDFYFFESKQYRTTSDLEKFELDTWHEIKQANQAAKEGHFFRHSHSCSNYGTCPYMPLCTGENGAEALYEFREPHEELDFLKGE